MTSANVEELLSDARMNVKMREGPVFTCAFDKTEKAGYWLYTAWCDICAEVEGEALRLGFPRLSADQATETAHAHLQDAHPDWTVPKAVGKE